MEDKDERRVKFEKLAKVSKVSKEISALIYKFVEEDKDTANSNDVGYVLWRGLCLTFMGITEGKEVSLYDFFHSIIMFIGFMKDAFISHGASMDTMNDGFRGFIKALAVHLNIDMLSIDANESSKFDLKEMDFMENLKEIEFMEKALSEIKRKIEDEQETSHTLN